MAEREKPVVIYGRLAGWEDHGERGVTAHLRNVQGHPRLGGPPAVYTSRVLRVEHDSDGHVKEIETQNTIYRRQT